MESIPVLLILLVASVVVFGTAADWCNTDRVACSGRTVWAIVAGAASSLIVLAMVFWQRVCV
jgi:hypothetical protein